MTAAKNPLGGRDDLEQWILDNTGLDFDEWLDKKVADEREALRQKAEREEIEKATTEALTIAAAETARLAEDGRRKEA